MADDDGGTPSGRSPKRQRVQPGPRVQCQFEELRVEARLLDEEEDVDEGREAEEEEEEGNDDVVYHREYDNVYNREDNDFHDLNDYFYVPEDEQEAFYVGENEEEEAVHEMRNNEDPESAVNCIRQLSPEPVEDVCGDGSLSATLADPNVLDCPICYKPLTVPVFQCDNGHVACNSCCPKMKNRCGSCTSPIGYNRCRAMEKVLESVTISCQYRKYGCTDSFPYGMKLTHNKRCAYNLCACILRGCTFEGSSKQLAHHFTSEHNYSVIDFRFTRPKFVTFGVDEKCVILREELHGSLFFVINRIGILGNMIIVSRLGPSRMEEDIQYEVVAKSLKCSLRMESMAKIVSKRIPPPASEFLLVPSGFFGPSCFEMKLDICIGLQLS